MAGPARSGPDKAPPDESPLCPIGNPAAVRVEEARRSVVNRTPSGNRTGGPKLPPVAPKSCLRISKGVTQARNIMGRWRPIRRVVRSISGHCRSRGQCRLAMRRSRAGGRTRRARTPRPAGRRAVVEDVAIIGRHAAADRRVRGEHDFKEQRPDCHGNQDLQARSAGRWCGGVGVGGGAQEHHRQPDGDADQVVQVVVNKAAGDQRFDRASGWRNRPPRRRRSSGSRR